MPARFISEVKRTRDCGELTAKDVGNSLVAVSQKPTTVVLEPESPTWLTQMPALLTSLLETLGGLALVLVLVVFMLLKREDLRNRLIRLVSHGQITVMTKALEDAGQRISRFLLMQLIVNRISRLIISVIIVSL